MTAIDTTAPIVTITKNDDGPWLITCTDGQTHTVRGSYQIDQVMEIADTMTGHTEHVWRRLEDGGFQSVGTIGF